MIPADAADDMAVIACPELGFTTVADPGYSWDYQEGTGIPFSYTAKYIQGQGDETLAALDAAIRGYKDM